MSMDDDDETYAREREAKANMLALALFEAEAEEGEDFEESEDDPDEFTADCFDDQRRMADASAEELAERVAARSVLTTRARLRGYGIDPDAKDNVQGEALAALLARAAALAERGDTMAARSLAQATDVIARAARSTASLGAGEVGSLPLVKFDLGHDGHAREQATLHVNIAAAKASLTRLITHALSGDTVVLCRAGHPLACIIPYERAIAETRETFAPPLALEPEPR